MFGSKGEESTKDRSMEWSMEASITKKLSKNLKMSHKNGIIGTNMRLQKLETKVC